MQAFLAFPEIIIINFFRASASWSFIKPCRFFSWFIFFFVSVAVIYVFIQSGFFQRFGRTFLLESNWSIHINFYSSTIGLISSEYFNAKLIQFFDYNSEYIEVI
ncbi:hypothetical protein EDEG_02740 [Edhazardia aedis USNM 41457]|uniref:Uncharacterized protein n=1 Tax=Edhazardia aedis (strain USNM 41457) TaxID=1003232 RepID=J9DJQ9_EDHAE|nr:hypothetical protein EDEG_02740 [Edhazardia aedis USNM 41457]|eukprot:EJW02860.1 hypothetical protein EDEG_02740 [Edhazardia aedis USNM 41457]